MSSIESNNGSASPRSESSSNTTPSTPDQASLLASAAGGTPLTQANLKKNDSPLANQLRLYEAFDKAKSIDEGFKSAFNETLPEKTKRQILESLSGVAPMQRFRKTADDQVGGPVDPQFWSNQAQIDPLAAELEAMQRPAAVAVA